MNEMIAVKEEVVEEAVKPRSGKGDEATEAEVKQGQLAATQAPGAVAAE